MSFECKSRSKIEEDLKQELDKNRVKINPENGFSYIESWDAINKANEIFGFLGWSSSIRELTRNSVGQDNDGFYASYSAVCSVSITASGHPPVTKDGVGFVSVKGRKTAEEAIDMAIKGAESDAEKRALRKFGDQFGLCLYNSAYYNNSSVNEESPKNEHSVSRGSVDNSSQGVKSYLNSVYLEAKETCYSKSELSSFMNSDDVCPKLMDIKTTHPEYFDKFTSSVKSLSLELPNTVGG